MKIFLVLEGGGKLVYVYATIWEEKCIGVFKYEFWMVHFLSMVVRGLPVGILREEYLDIRLSGKEQNYLWVMEAF